MSEKPVTNEEIQALLDALQGASGAPAPPNAPSGAAAANAKGGAAEPAVKPYDFARPHKFSKEQIRTLEMIYANCARRLTTQLSTLLRTHVEVDLKGIGETAYNEFFESISSLAPIALLGLPPLVGRALLQIDPSVAFGVIDRLLGGPGTSLTDLRELTEIEKGLMGRVFDRVLKCVADAWSTLVTLRPDVEMVIGGTLFSQIAMPDDRLVLAEFTIHLGSITDTIRFGIPVSALDPILGKLSAQNWFAGDHQSQNEMYQDSLRDSLNEMELELAVELGHAEVTVADLLDLQVGDVLRLGTKTGGDLNVVVGAEARFKGRPGRVGRRMGVQITHVLQPNSDEAKEEDEWTNS